jgi:dienelactone hydrolase
MQTSLTQKSVSVALVGGILVSLGGLPTTAYASDPIYGSASRYTIQIPTTGSLTGSDTADIYYPLTTAPAPAFPIAVMLQGALVNQADYENFATQVARYGFAVVVPNHLRNLGPVTGLFPDEELVNDVLVFMEQENERDTSPLEGRLDTAKLGLLGHSFGGSVGLAAIQDVCFPFLCHGQFDRPAALKAGIFYGTNFRNQATGEFLPIDNQKIPIGLIAGNRDSVALPANTEATYNQIQDPPKVLVTVEGANHYGITDEDNPLRDPSTPTLSQSVATETIARWSGLFLRAHVLQDPEALDYVYGIGDGQDENVTVRSARVPESSSTLGLFILGVGGVVWLKGKPKA